jgi:hypothetical protein
MDRCHGKTKSGARCKRSARKGSRFCATHASQSQGPGDADATGETSQQQDSLDTLIIPTRADHPSQKECLYGTLVGFHGDESP